MSADVLTRRAALTAFGAIALAPALAIRSAFAQPGVRFREIRVDVSPLRASAGDPTAAWVEEALPGALAQALGGYVSPRNRTGATLTARIDNLYLGPNKGAGLLGSSQDTIEGVLFVRGSRAPVAAVTPLRAITSYYPMGVDQPLRVESNYSRVTLLAQAFARWAPRELGL
jgi:hypothetical protein